jgi:16S rRNA processing protein RimM
MAPGARLRRYRVSEGLPGNRDQFLAIARILRPQGRQGEVAAEILTDFPERFENLRRAYLERPGALPEPVAVENAWPHKGRIILKLSGVDSIEATARLRGLHVLVPRQERVSLSAHQYYVWELTGCRVVRELQGTPSEVGTVTDVEQTGGAYLLHVAAPDGRGGNDRGSGKPREVLIPFAQAICTRIDPEAKIIVIDPPEDLLDLNS